MEYAMFVVAVVSALAAVSAAVVAGITYVRSKSPDVVAYLVSPNECPAAGLVVKNLGNGVAYNISLSDFDFEMCEPVFREMAVTSFLKKGIPMLAPNQERSTQICTTQYAVDNLEDKTYTVTVSYAKTPKGRTKTRGAYVLDYYSFAHTIYTDSDLHTIAKSVKKMARQPT